MCVERLDSSQETTDADDGNDSDHGEDEDKGPPLGEILGHSRSTDGGP